MFRNIIIDKIDDCTTLLQVIYFYRNASDSCKVVWRLLRWLFNVKFSEENFFCMKHNTDDMKKTKKPKRDNGLLCIWMMKKAIFHTSNRYSRMWINKLLQEKVFLCAALFDWLKRPWIGKLGRFALLHFRIAFALIY